MRFRFEGEGGNNIYLDDINLYTGGPSDEIVAGISENLQEISLNISPNPVEGNISIDFELSANQTVQLEVFDILGKSVRTLSVFGNLGMNSVVLDSELFAKGTYRVQLQGETVTATLPFVKL
jgi:hypothetical protein